MAVRKLGRIAEMSAITLNLPTKRCVDEFAWVAVVDGRTDSFENLLDEVPELVIAQVLDELEVEVRPAAVCERTSEFLDRFVWVHVGQPSCASVPLYRPTVRFDSLVRAAMSPVAERDSHRQQLHNMMRSLVHQDHATPGNSRPGVAIIGLGVMGTRMLASLSLHGGFQIVSAWDPSRSARVAVAADYPQVRIAESAADAVGSEGVTVVYIACPPSAHLEYARLAADAGCVVYCEKPLGVDVEEASDLVETFRERDVINAVNFPFAANPPVDRLQGDLSDGLLGEVVGVDVRLHFVPWPRIWQQQAAWLADREEGGYVREVGSHFVFLIEKLFGAATLVQSSVTYPDDGHSCETGFAATLDCDGVPVSLAGNSVGVGPDVVEMTIWGTRRSIRLTDWLHVDVASGHDWERQTVYGADMRRDNNSRFFDDLLNLVHGRPNTMASFSEALSVQRIVETILAG